MDDLSSCKPRKIYLSGDIPSLWYIYMPQLTQASTNSFEYMKKCIILINDNGGFTVVRWYKRGIINVKILITAKNINGGGNIGNHKNKIMASKCKFMRDI